MAVDADRAHVASGDGQVGTAAVRTGKHPVWASWFVGYRGDVAIAVLELGHSPATSAAPLAAQILAAAP